MGVRVTFFHSAADGILADIAERPLQAFAAWLEDGLRSFPQEFEPALAELLRDVVERGPVALAAIDARSSRVVDRLIDLYYAGDWNIDACTPADESVLRLSGYQDAAILFQASAVSPHTRLLWSYLFVGRAAGRDTNALPYHSEDGVFHVGYWTGVEIGALRTSIQAVQHVDLHTPAWHALSCAERAITAAQNANHGLIFTIG